jgi:hypothetical protein
VFAAKTSRSHHGPNVLLDTGVAWTYQDFATTERNFNPLVLAQIGLKRIILDVLRHVGIGKDLRKTLAILSGFEPTAR